MDSLTQLALGAAVSVAVMGRRTPLMRAAAWGAVCGTLPDLDALIDHGDAVRNMTLHRAESHALFYLSVAAPVLAMGIAWVHRQGALFRRWWLAVWLALATHPLLDTMTIYGTQLAHPWTDHPYGVGSIFIIDPLYTLPLMLGLGLTLFRRDHRPIWNAAGLFLSTLYLGWGVAAQAHVRHLAADALHAQGLSADQMLIQPTPFNSVLWRVVAMEGDHYYEAYRSLFDPTAEWRFDRFDRGLAWLAALQGHEPVDRLIVFSHGFCAAEQVGGRVRISDLRMGQAPVYFFTFEVAEVRDETLMPMAPHPVGGRAPGAMLSQWLWPRMLGRTAESGSEWLVRYASVRTDWCGAGQVNEKCD